MSKTILERLADIRCDRAPFTAEHANCTCRVAHAAANEIKRQAAEIERLRATLQRREERLEIDSAYRLDGKRETIAPDKRDTFPDGIDARNATIELLENSVERLRTAVVAEREACAKIADETTMQIRLDRQEATVEWEAGWISHGKKIATAIRARGEIEVVR